MGDRNDDETGTSVNLNSGKNSGPFKPSPLKRGELFAGRYYILSKLGSGGMGAVYKARDIVVDRLVALKILAPHTALDEKAILQLQGEARAFSRLNHPHLVRLYDFSVAEDGMPFLVTEYVHGVTLANILDIQQKLPPHFCAMSMQGVARGLKIAHDYDIVHRDLKPGNCIFALNENFKFKVLDFGIAQRNYADFNPNSEEKIVIGTIHYMSPEQLNGERVDARSDQYALGCVIYECLTGEVPLSGTNWMVTKYLRDKEKVDTTKLPPEFVPVVDKLLQRDPGKRFFDMIDVAKSLEAIEKLGGN